LPGENATNKMAHRLPCWCCWTAAAREGAATANAARINTNSGSTPVRCHSDVAARMVAFRPQSRVWTSVVSLLFLAAACMYLACSVPHPRSAAFHRTILHMKRSMHASQFARPRLWPVGQILQIFVFHGAIQAALYAAGCTMQTNTQPRLVVLLLCVQSGII
jgi:hypothetical protein